VKPKPTITVRVYHSYYGCDTGCCGHRVEITPADEKRDGEEREAFEFEHPPSGDDLKAWAREFAEEQIRRRWPDCLDSIDWDSLDIEGVNDCC
jgi:hypothetical protein